MYTYIEYYTHMTEFGKLTGTVAHKITREDVAIVISSTINKLHLCM